MTRKEHLDWCKQRALEYVDAGELKNAFSSMMSDLRKHTETENHAAIRLGLILQMGGQLSTPQQMRDYITGFN